MPTIMTNNNMLMCMFGAGPFKVNAMSNQIAKINGMNILTEKDLTMMQMSPTCISPANPGIKLPFVPVVPCSFVGASWIAPSQTTQVNKSKVLLVTSKIMCTVGQGLLTFMP